jgi:cytochrome c553
MDKASSAYRWFLPVLLLSLVLGTAPVTSLAHQSAPKSEPAAEAPPPAQHDETGGHVMAMPDARNMAMPRMDATRGRKLFVSKGCVACHSINGVGGHDATALDAHTMTPMMNPFDFAAKMWRMAPAMIYAQEEALGEQILFTGDELADIIAFVHDDGEQHNFTDADISPEAAEMMDHGHGDAGGGPAAHGEEIGHHHGTAMPGGHHDDEPAVPPAQ